MKRNISKSAVKRLRAAAAKYFDDDEQYRAFLSGYDVESTLELSEDQAEDALRIINSKLKSQRKQSSRNVPVYHATDEQLHTIDGLFRSLGWDSIERQAGFIRKQTGATKAPRMLTKAEASKVITGLQRIEASQCN